MVVETSQEGVQLYTAQAMIVGPEQPAQYYLGGVVHGAGANDSDEWRFGLHVSVVAGWLRAEENHFLTVAPDEAAKLPAEAQALLGFESYGELARLGLVDFDRTGPRQSV